MTNTNIGKKSSTYTVYLLQCKDKTLYCGITNNLNNRLKSHNSGRGSAYVRSRGGGKIVYTTKRKNKSLALQTEAKIKKLTRLQKIKLVKNYQTKNHRLKTIRLQK